MQEEQYTAADVAGGLWSLSEEGTRNAELEVWGVTFGFLSWHFHDPDREEYCKPLGIGRLWVKIEGRKEQGYRCLEPGQVMKKMEEYATVISARLVARGMREKKDRPTTGGELASRQRRLDADPFVEEE